MKLAFESDPADDVSVLHCHGRISRGEGGVGFLEQLAKLCSHSRRLVVDLSGIEIVDQAGLGELVIALMWTQANGCELKLAAAKPPLHQLLEVTNLLLVFETHPTVEEAALSFRQSPKKAKAAACTAA